MNQVLDLREKRSMQSGYLALLDVLGFSALVSGDQGGRRLEDYFSVLQEAFDTDAKHEGIQHVVFSDTIIITTKDDSRASLKLILRQCSIVFSTLLKKEIPIRGAVSHGDFLMIPGDNGVFVAGKAIIDAHAYESMQDWVGIMLCPSVLAVAPHVRDLCQIPTGVNPSEDDRVEMIRRLDWIASVQSCQNIPFRTGNGAENSKYEGFAVVPNLNTVDPKSMAPSVHEIRKALDRLRSIAPDPAAQSKYTSSILWLGKIASDYQLMASWLQ